MEYIQFAVIAYIVDKKNVFLSHIPSYIYVSLHVKSQFYAGALQAFTDFFYDIIIYHKRIHQGVKIS